MPELAEAFVLGAQLAQLLGVPLETDSRLKLAPHLAITRLTPEPEAFSLHVEDQTAIYGDLSIVDDLTAVFPARVQHQGKKLWILWKDEDGAIETEVRLGMTGSFSLVRTPHTRLEFWSDRGSFYFNDIRKFGGLSCNCNPVAPSATARLNRTQAYYDLQEFSDFTLKAALTDQNYVVSGVGNYVVNEVLHRAHLHPDTCVGLLQPGEFSELLSQLQRVVVESARLGGCTLRDFRDLLGRPGAFQTRLLVYGKTKCTACGGPIQVLRREGETTSWVCPTCQPLR